ncbi:MAG: hypothetical protein KA953_00650 [Lachnospiraceae bacterium]|nr:hypothetical protein [Lachnospiraceae bacterium]
MKFKVGDKVRVRSWESMEKEFGLNRWGEINCPIPVIEGMKEYCGTIQTITAILHGIYYMGNTGYYFDENSVEPVKQETKGEHNRKEIKQIRQQYKEMGVCNSVAVNKNDKPCSCAGLHCEDCLLNGSNVTCKERFKKWCAEPYKAPEEQPKPAKKSILDKTEHDYLAAVIAPKRIHKNVVSISKRSLYRGETYCIYIEFPYGIRDWTLPYFFESDHMYDGMEVNRPYTLGELGL